MYMNVLTHSVVNNCNKKKKKRVSERFRQVVGSIVVLFDAVSAATLAELFEARVSTTRICDTTAKPMLAC